MWSKSMGKTSLKLQLALYIMLILSQSNRHVLLFFCCAQSGRCFFFFNIIGSSPAWFVSNANLKSANKTKTNPLSTYIRCVLAQSNSYRSGNTIVKNCTEPEQSSLDLISSEPIPSNYLQPVQMRSQSYNMRPSSVRQVTMRNTLPDAMIQHPAHKFHGNSIY